MRTREATLPDAEQIHALVSNYSGDGTLLPRSLAEICENVRDFVVLEDGEGRIIGCGALLSTAGCRCGCDSWTERVTVPHRP